MTDPHPQTRTSGAARGHLRALRGPASEPDATTAPVLRGGVRRGPVVLLTVALGALAFWLALEVRHAARLEAQVDALGQQLTETRTALEAQRARLGEVRGRVRGLRAEVESLDSLLASEPTPAPNAVPEAAATR